MNVGELLNTVIPFVQYYPKNDPKGRTGINYSTWEDVTFYDCILGDKMLSFKEKNEYFRSNFDKDRDKNAYTSWKEENALYCYPGIIGNHSVKGEKVIGRTGIISIDIDKQDNREIFADPELLDLTLRNIQAWIPYVFAMTKSIGCGYVFYAYIDIPGNNYEEWNRNNEKIYEYIRKDFRRFNNLVVDARCGNLNRARFIAYDDKPWVATTVEQLTFDPEFFEEPESYQMDDMEAHTNVTKCSIGKFTITKPMDYYEWWRVYMSLSSIYGFERGKIEYRKFCEALVEANNQHPDWPHQHSLEHIYNNALGAKEKWKNPDVQLLRSIGYDIEVEYANDKLTLRESFDNNVSIVPEGHYLLDYKQDVLDFWEKHRTMMLVGCTGLGKTILVKWLSHKKKCIILVPYLDMLELYMLDDEGVVKGVTQVLTGETMDDFTPDKSCCIIWDQMYRIFSKLDDYCIIVDECHTVAKSSTFRPSATRLNCMLKKFIERGNQVMFVTATPTLEVEEYHIPDESTMYFDRQGYIRPIEVRYNMVDVYGGEDGQEHPGSAKLRIVGDVMYNHKVNRYDYVLIWSDKYNMFLTDYLTIKGVKVNQVSKRAAVFEKDVKERINYIKNKNLLPEKGVYTFTQLTENGFNFNNETGTALVIIQVNKNDFSYAKIVQIMGRLRKLPYVYTKIYVEDEVNEELTPEDKHVRANIMDNSRLQLANDPLYRSKEVMDHVDHIKAYEAKHGNIESLKNDLEGYLKGGKFRISLIDMSDGKRLGTARNDSKREAEKEAWEMIKNDSAPEDLHGKELFYAANHLFNLYGKNEVITWVDILKQKAKSDKMISTCLQEIGSNLPWLDEEYADSQERLLKHILNRKKIPVYEGYNSKGELITIEYDLSESLKKTLLSELKRHKDWVKKYKKCRDICDVVKMEKESLVEDLMEIKVVRSKAHSVKHKPHKDHKKKLLKVVEDGFVGTTEEVMVHIGKNRDTVTRWKRMGKIVDK